LYKSLAVLTNASIIQVGMYKHTNKAKHNITRIEGRAQREATRNRRGGEATGGKESGGE